MDFKTIPVVFRDLVDTIAEDFGILPWLARRVAARSFERVSLGTSPASMPSFRRTTDWERLGWTSYISVPGLRELVLKEEVKDFCCSIHDVDGLSASRDPLEKCVIFDEFAQRYCKGLIENVTAEQLEKCWKHCDVRIMKDSGNFRLYTWDGGLYLMNGDGSHNFAAARYIAKRLSVDVTLQAPLYRHKINPDAVRKLRDAFDVYALTAKDCDWVIDQAQRFNVPKMIIQAPPPHDENERLLFLSKNISSAASMSKMLSQAGILNVGFLLHKASTLQ